MTELEKLWAGLEYNMWDPELRSMKTGAILGCEKLNSISGLDTEGKDCQIQKYLWIRTENMYAVQERALVRTNMPFLMVRKVNRLQKHQPQAFGYF